MTCPAGWVRTLIEASSSQAGEMAHRSRLRSAVLSVSVSVEATKIHCSVNPLRGRGTAVTLLP